MQTLLQLDIWLQSYEGFDNAKNNMKQRNLNTVFANISKTTFPISDFIPLDHVTYFYCFGWKSHAVCLIRLGNLREKLDTARKMNKTS